jgi:hypothetical protein
MVLDRGEKGDRRQATGERLKVVVGGGGGEGRLFIRRIVK